MKKWILFLVFAIFVSISYKTIFSLAQDTEDRQQIEKILEKFLNSFVSNDFDSMMSQVSINYSDERDDKFIDYNMFKSIIKEGMDSFFKKYVNSSVSELQIHSIEFKGDRAYVVLGFIRKSYNLETLREENWLQSILAILVKEDGAWRIVTWKRLKPEEAIR